MGSRTVQTPTTAAAAALTPTAITSPTTAPSAAYSPTSADAGPQQPLPATTSAAGHRWTAAAPEGSSEFTALPTSGPAGSDWPAGTPIRRSAVPNIYYPRRPGILSAATRPTQLAVLQSAVAAPHTIVPRDVTGTAVARRTTALTAAGRIRRSAMNRAEWEQMSRVAGFVRPGPAGAGWFEGLPAGGAPRPGQVGRSVIRVPMSTSGSMVTGPAPGAANPSMFGLRRAGRHFITVNPSSSLPLRRAPGPAAPRSAPALQSVGGIARTASPTGPGGTARQGSPALRGQAPAAGTADARSAAVHPTPPATPPTTIGNTDTPPSITGGTRTPLSTPPTTAGSTRTPLSTPPTTASSSRAPLYPEPEPITAAGSYLLLRQVIGPTNTIVPATAAVIRRAPAPPPPGVPRGGPASPRLSPLQGGPPTGTGEAQPPAGWTTVGTAMHGPLPGTLTPAALAAFGAAATGTTRITRTFSGGSAGQSHLPTTGREQATRAGIDAGSGETIRRSLVDLAPASLFERAGLLRRARLGPPGAPEVEQAPDLPPTANTRGAFGRPVAGAIRRARTIDGTTYAGGQMSLNADDETQEPAVVDALTSREWDELVDLVVDRIEDRVRDELARRGRRFSPGVF